MVPHNGAVATRDQSLITKMILIINFYESQPILFESLSQIDEADH